MVGAAGLLGWMAGHTDVMFADGLRYIQQARRIDAGSWTEGLLRAVDHPAYPLAIAGVHRSLGGDDAPVAWQQAAQGGVDRRGRPAGHPALPRRGSRSSAARRAWLAVVLCVSWCR